MSNETHLSNCCRAPIMVKKEGQGLYCSKCGSEIFSTIIIENIKPQKELVNKLKEVYRNRIRRKLLCYCEKAIGRYAKR
jgi:hypothetical protein